MRRSLLRLVVLVGFVLGCGDSGDAATPHIDSLAPAMAGTGGTIDILGRHFCGGMGANDDGSCTETISGFVTFGTAPAVARATVASWKDTRIQVVVPVVPEAGVTTVVVTVDGVQSNAADFEVLP